MKRIISWLAAIALILGLVMVSTGCTARTAMRHPWVFVHGLNGFGEDDRLPLQYWGATGGNLLEALRYEGFEVYAPTVSPAGSAWSRAAELFAQLTGTQVDYGIAHSEAHGTERFGVAHDTPLFEGWGQYDENGSLRRVNLLGHSFGGNTIRMLAALLQDGCANEQAAAREAGEEVSPLFAGGKSDWVFSITTIASPHNGVSLLSLFDINPTMVAIAEALPQAQIDQTMQALGINIPGITNLAQFLRAAESQNTAFADLTLNGAQLVNQRTGLAPATFYFSFPVSGTDANGRPDANDMSIPSRLLATQIALFTHPASGITSIWRENDGLVNTISATRPFTEAHVDVATLEGLRPEPGIWHVMPTVRGDHGSVVGLGRNLTDLLPMYLEHMQMVDGLR